MSEREGMPKGEMRSRPTREDIELQAEGYKSLYDKLRSSWIHDEAMKHIKKVLQQVIDFSEAPSENWDKFDEPLEEIYAGWKPDDYKELFKLVRKRIPNLYREMN